MSMFELATRNKIRFTHKGVLSTEDLWDLRVEDLDTIFQGLNTQLKASKEDSLLQKRTTAQETLELKVELVKYIVGVKLAEAEERKAAVAKIAKKREIMNILAEKQVDSLKGKSEAELLQMLNEL